MASPRTIGARVYFNQEEIDGLTALKERLHLSESGLLRYLMLRGLKVVQKEHAEEEEHRIVEDLIAHISERGERSQVLRSA